MEVRGEDLLYFFGGGHGDNIPSSAKPRLRADATTRETSTKTCSFFTELVITFEVLTQMTWGARIWKVQFWGINFMYKSLLSYL